MAVGTTTAVLLGLGGVGAGFGASKLMAPSAKVSSPIALPQPPSQADAGAKAADIVRRKKADVTQTVFTSPLGAPAEAAVAKKVLLGQ